MWIHSILTLITVLLVSFETARTQEDYTYDYGTSGGNGGDKYDYNYDSSPVVPAPVVPAPVAPAPVAPAPVAPAPVAPAPVAPAPVAPAPVAPAPPAIKPVVTTTLRVTTNAHPNPSVNQICPENPGMNDRLRKKALDMHNYRRSILAQGNVVNHNKKALPKAANMMKLKYDCTLETEARGVVNKCTDSPPSPSSGMEQNILRLRQSQYRYRLDAIEAAVKQWWKQVRIRGIGLKVTFRAKHQNTPISHFTRMAWATTTKLGCAVSTAKKCATFWYIACLYKEGGNKVETPLYTIGNPCNQCPNGAKCEGSLCVVS